ncbi:MAG: heme-binding domain-containing protein [Flavobacteriaceae bacterium]|nr:heme-binding domain-containing protein [Flavobacteriaceae bacterium]
MRKKVFLILLIIIIAMQFYRPAKNMASETPATDFLVVNHAPENISEMIRGACYDCHSDNTVYPWYAEVAPVSWWIANHVEDGKKHLNFSTWADYDDKRKAKKLDHIDEALTKRFMPMKVYIPMHPEAKLSDEQIKSLTDWVKSLEN